MAKCVETHGLGLHFVWVFAELLGVTNFGYKYVETKLFLITQIPAFELLRPLVFKSTKSAKKMAFKVGLKKKDQRNISRKRKS